MATRPCLDDAKTIGELAHLFPKKNGQYPSNGKIRRWIARGSRGIRLQGWRIGGEWYTTPAAIVEFNSRSNPTGTPATTMRNSTRAATVRRILEAEGFGDEKEANGLQNLRRSRRNVRSLLGVLPSGETADSQEEKHSG